MDEIRAKFVVVGAGPAGCSAAKTLIELTSIEDVLLIGRESTLAYERPPLSKKALLEIQTQPELLGEAHWLLEQQAHTLLNTTVVKIHPSERYLITNQNQKIHYQKLLLCVGADPRRLNIAGEQLGGVFTLREFQDAQHIKAKLQAGKKLVVVGSGFIGLEVAATARQLGLEVTVISLTSQLMSRSMPQAVSDVFLAKFIEQGIRFKFNTSLAQIQGQGQVERVVLANGEVLDTDMVVVGIGAQPNCQHLLGIEQLLENGIVVDAHGQTSDPYIFAAGDVANRKTHFADTEFHARIEAWEPAREQGRAVAQFMAQHIAADIDAPWMWSDQFDWNLQALGYGHLATQQLILGDRESARFTILQFKDDGQLVGAITVNNGKDMLLCRRALKNKLRVAQHNLHSHADLTLKQFIALATA